MIIYGNNNQTYDSNKQNRLKKQDIINQPHFADLSEEEIDSLIEFIWDYSIIVYKAFEKTNSKNDYE